MSRASISVFVFALLVVSRAVGQPDGLPERIEVTFEQDFVVGDTSSDLFFSISTPAASGPDTTYRVGIAPVADSSPLGITYQGPTRLDIPAGTSHAIGPFSLNASVAGDWSVPLQLAFEDGVTVEATVTGRVEPRPVSNRPADGVVFAETTWHQLVSIPEPSPGPGYLASRVQVRSLAHLDAVVTVANMQVSGAHQVWAGHEIAGSRETAKGRPVAGEDYDSSWIAYDSHYLILETMIGGGAGGGYQGVRETNDGSTSDSLVLPQIMNVAPKSGLGSMSLATPDKDAFFFTPQFQAADVDLFYAVTPADSAPVEMTIGVIGRTAIDIGGASSFGYDDDLVANNAGAISIPFFVPEPSFNLLWSLVIALFFGLVGRRA